MSDQDNRRSFRVSESAYVRYEVIDDKAFHDGLEHRKLQLGVDDGAQAQLVDLDARLSEAMYRVGAQNEYVGKCITLLNDKINLALHQLPSFREGKAALLKRPPQTCDVGADGMVFAAHRQFDVGSKLHLQFLLASDNRYVETFCSVVRHTDPPSDADAELPYGIAVEFHGMSASQREVLIQHMFNLQGETLRMRRLQLDKEEEASG